MTDERTEPDEHMHFSEYNLDRVLEVLNKTLNNNTLIDEEVD